MTFLGDKHVLSERRAQPRRAVEGGGEIVAGGTPEDASKEPHSYTVGYLKDLVAKSFRAEIMPAPPRKKRVSVLIRQREPAA